MGFQLTSLVSEKLRFLKSKESKKDFCLEYCSVYGSCQPGNNLWMETAEYFALKSFLRENAL